MLRDLHETGFGTWTHWYRRDSVAKSRSWESAVFGGGRYHKLWSEVKFHVEGNSSSSFVGRTVLAEEKVTWETRSWSLSSSCSHVSVTHIIYSGAAGVFWVGLL